MNKHERQANDFQVSLYFKRGEPGSQLWRATCSCEWAGAWYGNLDYVSRSFDRHVAQASQREAVSA